jgi:hypothetical protein
MTQPIPSAIPRAIDALLATVARVTAAAPNDWQVIDGWPGVNQQTNIIAIAWGDDAVKATQSAAYAGNGRRWEDFGIACVISCWTGGYENAEQKAARDRAFDLLDRIATEIRSVSGTPAGSTLPDADGQPTVLYGEITEAQYSATDGEDASLGRFAQITFTITAKKVIG